MTQVAMLGAGSVVFGKNLMADILWHPALKGCQFRLMDIDAERLTTAGRLARALNSELDGRAEVVETEDRQLALEGADFVICTVGVGGLSATRDDLLIPAEYGLRQAIGDTLGAGGIFRSLRSIPVLLDICADMERLCPDALLLNYANPMAMHCLAVSRATKIQCVGLCHGVQGTARTLRMYVGMMENGVKDSTIHAHMERPWGDPQRNREWATWMAMGEDPELRYACAGINHMAFFLRLASGDRDLYPALRRAAERPGLRRLDPVRFELFDRLGYFMTETSHHTAEYVPWFMQHEEEIRRLEIPVNRYLDTCERQDEAYAALRHDLENGTPLLALPYQPSIEYASRIMNAIVTGTPYLFNGNVHNRGGAIISNLPGDCCVEVPCVADGNGLTPTAQGDLPPQCAALIRTNVNVQDLTVRAILEGRREHIRHALMLDPNTAATLTLPQIDRLCEDLFRAHKAYMPGGSR